MAFTSMMVCSSMWICVFMFIMCICEEGFAHAHMQRSRRSALGMFLCCFCGRGSLAWPDSESWGLTYCHSPPSTMQRCTAILGFCVDAGDLYSYFHTHTTSSLPAGPSPPSSSSSFRLRIIQIMNFYLYSIFF